MAKMKTGASQHNAAKTTKRSATTHSYVILRNKMSTFGATVPAKKLATKKTRTEDKLPSCLDDADDVVILTPPTNSIYEVHDSDSDDARLFSNSKASYAKSAQVASHVEKTYNSKTTSMKILDSDSDSSVEFFDAHHPKRKVKYLRSSLTKDDNKSTNEHIGKCAIRTSMFDGLSTDEFFKRLNDCFDKQEPSSTNTQANNDGILASRTDIKLPFKSKSKSTVQTTQENDEKVSNKQQKIIVYQHNTQNQTPPIDNSGIGWPDEMRAFYLQPRESKQLKNNIGKNRKDWQISQNEYLSPKQNRKNMKCYNCFQFGHIKAKCGEPAKPLICFMCGEMGHRETNCVNTKCLNCGRDTKTFQRRCQHCFCLANSKCNICSCFGHNAENCPDQWRRYYGTTTNNGAPSGMGNQLRNKRIYCSACARRGHLVENCNQAGRVLDYPVTTSRIINNTSVYPENINFADGGINLNLLYNPTQPVQFRMSNNVSCDRTANIEEKANASMVFSENSLKIIKKPKLKKTKTCFSDPMPKYIPLDSGTIVDTPKANITKTEAKIYLNEAQIIHLRSAKGSKDLEEIAKEWNITTSLEAARVGYMLILHGTATNLGMFRNSLLNNMEEHLYKYDRNKEVELPVPKRVFLLIKDLSRYIQKLNDNLGNVHHLHKKVIEFMMQPNKSNDLKTRGARRSLNMILFGQAGLADGHVHLKRLLELFKHLTAMPAKEFVNSDMRKEIGDILKLIFSSNVRDNYAELIAEYEKLPKKNIVDTLKQSTNVKSNGDQYGGIKRKLQPKTTPQPLNKRKKFRKESTPLPFQRYFQEFG